MLVLPGHSALSDFRLNRLLENIQTKTPQITALSAQYIYFADLQEELEPDESDKLSSLLQIPNRPIQQEPGLLLLVTPRPGTISPWSSKASDIIHNCGLNKIRRVERGIRWQLNFANNFQIDSVSLDQIKAQVHDRMTETVFDDVRQAESLFQVGEPRELITIPLLSENKAALMQANQEMGLALSDDEIDYLYAAFNELKRNPTNVELMMFAQANSEHCRHKIFNADWVLDGQEQSDSLFGMIRKTHEQHPGRVLSAYHDNAAVMAGYAASRFFPAPEGKQYEYHEEDVHILMKVETHNHPTAISPYPGAATGAGGEIRDEAATGIGGKPKAGLTGFAVSNLKLPQQQHAWEHDHGKPARIVSALDIMLEGPIGAASYNNEFGRPALCGYFRSYEQRDPVTDKIRGYHKPIMLAGGYGTIRPIHVEKGTIPPGAKLIVLGGPAMLIGLGGGAASSMASGESHEELDFASVQRDNPEIERRCQEVVDRCWALGDKNPIISIHDVGAGGLSNALPELVNDSDRGARFELRDIPNADLGMSPMEIWCNEAQERYVLAIASNSLESFVSLCERERAPFAVIGEANASHQLELNDSLFNNKAIDMPLSVLLGKAPRMLRQAEHATSTAPAFSFENIKLEEAVTRVLQLPTVADKSFLITIGDRTISGLVVRDQMVGPWQTPVADCAITAASYDAYVGEAMAIGERSPVAVINPAASGRLAIAEAITNICAARILRLGDIALSANWMAACGQAGEDAALFDTVKAASELARSLNIPIPVGKDSLSMNTVWQQDEQESQVISPLSLNVTAFAPVADIRRSLTPMLQKLEDSCLLLIDLSSGKNRLGGSALAQVFNQTGNITPDIDEPELLKSFFQTVQLLNDAELLLAYHDRSDGGLFVTLCEMAFAGRTGLDINLDQNRQGPLAQLFNEEPGAVIQVARTNLKKITETFQDAGFSDKNVYEVANINDDQRININTDNNTIYSEDLSHLHRLWSSTSYHMQSLRDNPECAQEEYDRLLDRNDPGLSFSIPFNTEEKITAPYFNKTRPKIAILREQGVNGQVEMAAAFERAGFDCFDVHMNDLIQQDVSLTTFHGLVACGGFSYGDVLGAGGGWAKSILFNEQLRDEFQSFFNRNDSFGLGVCNGCQMLSQLRELIPGTKHWPRFVRNRSEQFESRLVMVEVMESSSIFLTDMAKTRVPIAVAHGEGRPVFSDNQDSAKSNPALRYINNYGDIADNYPANPNGSTDGLTGFTSDDGRFTIMMPHPERVFLKKQYSWIPKDWKEEDGPWMRLFQNARHWLG